MPMNEADLLRLLRSTEHTFVERKSINDGRDWVKSAVAFANTLEPSQEGVLFIAAKDNGEIEASASLDKLQKSFSEKMESAYPPIFYTTRTVAHEGRECLAVIVPGSPNKPHYAGLLYLRDGSQTVIANAEKHDSLLAWRTSKARALLEWKGKRVSLRTLSRQAGVAYVLNETRQEATLVDCNQFYVTLRRDLHVLSYPLARIEISFDHVGGRLEIEMVVPIG